MTDNLDKPNLTTPSEDVPKGRPLSFAVDDPVVGQQTRTTPVIDRPKKAFSMSRDDAIFWIGIAAFGDGLYLMADHPYYGISLLLVGIAMLAWANRGHMPKPPVRMAVLILAFVSTIAAVGFDIYDRHFVSVMSSGGKQAHNINGLPPLSSFAAQQRVTFIDQKAIPFLDKDVTDFITLAQSVVSGWPHRLDEYHLRKEFIDDLNTVAGACNSLVVKYNNIDQNHIYEDISPSLNIEYPCRRINAAISALTRSLLGIRYQEDVFKKVDWAMLLDAPVQAYRSKIDSILQWSQSSKRDILKKRSDLESMIK